MNMGQNFRIFNFIVFIHLAGSWSHVNAANTVVELNESNWRLMLNGEWMVEFFAPWCPACKGLEATWKSFAEWSEDLNIKVAQVDITTSPGLSGRFIVTALPTIYHVKDGEFRQYKGSRDKSSLMSFIEDAKWQQTDPLPAWKSPVSIQMGVVASFFKLSQVLRGLHNDLMETYGIPTWGSYVLFALSTIIVGAVMGLLLVCVIDFFYPPKPTTTVVEEKQEKPEEMQNEADEVSKEDLIDDNSELEKNSGSDSEDDDEDADENKDANLEAADPSMRRTSKKNSDVSAGNSPTSSPNPRKRKPRKAD